MRFLNRSGTERQDERPEPRGCDKRPRFLFEKGVLRYSRETERSICFYAMVAMAVLWALSHLFG